MPWSFGARLLLSTNRPLSALRLVDVVAKRFRLALRSFLHGALTGVVADRLVAARNRSPSMRVRIVPLLQVRRRAARLLLLFNWGFPRLIGLLCGFLVRSLARIVARLLP